MARKKFCLVVSAALCCSLVAGPVAAASPVPPTPTPTPTPTPSASSKLTIQEDPLRERERMAVGFRTVGKFGGATGATAELAGLVIGGERDPKTLDAALADADKGLDNLLAIIPGGSLTRAKMAGYDIRGSVALLKTDQRALVEAGVKGDVASFMGTAAFLMVHLALLAADIFFGLGLSIAQAFIPFPLPTFTVPDFKFPWDKPQPTATPTPSATPSPTTTPSPSGSTS
ncbi:hypothetical protein [Streptomyces sp. NBC_01465]|uniref:hypothetical protein n=1 Tax=Streptomyces sp. NBC_01465 TaxID=2903878 RepID=UPI002E3127C0|nr:hypothetical protein [Streptomyces sp. NBC_01465]